MKQRLLALSIVVTSVMAGPVWADCTTLCDQAWWEKASVDDIIAQMNTGLDMSDRDLGGSTMMHWAAGFGKTDVVLGLLTTNIGINDVDYYGQTPLHWAVLTGSSEIILRLLDVGADTTFVGVDGKSVLDLADENENLKGTAAYKALLNAKKASVSAACPKLCDDRWWESAKLADLRAELEAGANPNAFSLQGWTPLHKAVWRGDPKATLVLLEFGADAKAQAQDGKTPWNYAEFSKKMTGTKAYWALKDAQEE
jgi:ankyrin repeat protein